MNGNNRHRKHYDKNKKVFKKKEDINTYQCDDFISCRLQMHEKESCDLEGLSINVSCMLKQASEEETECWIELSSLVKSRKSLGFPLLRGVKKFTYGRLLYFEQFKNMKVEKLVPKSCYISDAVLFQVAVILYSMHKKEIYVDNFEFNVVSIPKTMFYVSVNQLTFELCTDKLVILSLCTRPYKVSLQQSCYLNFLHCFETISRKSYEMSNYFFEWLIKNHVNMLSKEGIDIFRLKRKSINSNHVNRFIEPGTIVLINRGDVFMSGITLTNVSVSDNVRVLFSSDGGYILEIEDFNIQEMFLPGDYIIRSQLNTIAI
ncbi:62L protein [Yaba-like disease virus]|uniref:62L protein n=1 Tax=Yaba-like disease virus TaxID=132475 RepID=Q9DHQ1_YLDV|nr:62L protein [Yaba-like disease virus]CAC21300.1 62L protein [Yaba-like disease virus]